MRRLLSVLFFYSFLCACCFASTSSTLGYVEPSSTVIRLNNSDLSTYRILDSDYIPVSSLASLGHSITFDSASNIATIGPSQGVSSSTTPSSFDYLVGSPFTYFDGTVNFNGFITHAIFCEGRTLIPIGALRQCYMISIDGSIYTLTPKEAPSFTVDSSMLVNPFEFSTEFQVTDLYFDDGFISITSDYTLDAYQTLERTPAAITPSALYISSRVTSATNTTLNYSDNNFYGQLNTSLLETYAYALKPRATESFGDPISIPEIREIEAFVNAQGLSSPTPFLVYTDLANQRTYIFEGNKGNWRLLKHFVCSTGRSYTPTPKGTFNLTHKVPYFGVEKGYRCKNAFGFIGTSYLYHSILFDRTGSYLLENEGVLGQPASQGCIRFSEKNSEWFYNTLLPRTTVFIN